MQTVTFEARPGTSPFVWWHRRYNSPRWEWARTQTARKRLVVASVVVFLLQISVQYRPMPPRIWVPIVLVTVAGWLWTSYALLQSTRGVTARRASHLTHAELLLRYRVHSLSYRALINICVLALIARLGGPGTFLGVCLFQIGFMISIGLAAWLAPDDL